MKSLWIASCAIATIAFTTNTRAEVAGTLLFAQTGTQIVGTTGTARAAKKGDVLQSGERLVTPPDAVSQVMLPDGSLIGMRPSSEVRIDQAAAGSDAKAPVVSLVSGTARVISVDLLDAKKVPNFTLQSGNATVKLKAADLESSVVKSGDPSRAAGSAPGSYQRLLVGSGNVNSGNVASALTPRQVSFVGVNGAAPITLAAAATPSMFATTRGTPSTSTAVGTAPKGAAAVAPVLSVLSTAAPKPIVMAPTVNLPNLPVVPVTPPAGKPCTRFVGKTCVQ